MNALGVIGIRQSGKRERQWNRQIRAPKTGMQIRRRPGQVLPYAMTVAREWNPPHRVRHVAIEAWKKPEAVFSWQGIDTGVGHRYRSRLTAQCLTFEHRHREPAVHEFVRGG